MNILRSFGIVPQASKQLIFGVLPSTGPFLLRVCEYYLSGSNGHKETTGNHICEYDWSAVMCVYSASFMRFAWVVRPRNLHLLVCHMTNETMQLYQLSRWFRAQRVEQNKEEINVE
ncbi:hypothetical protein ACSQ67_000754 [Phaseolus vulgaris]